MVGKKRTILNHVAHCFLSFGQEAVLVGNFIGDFVKGNDWQNYPQPIQSGLLLHRHIDAYTDNHIAINQMVQLIRPFARRYSPPIVDVLCDFLLIHNFPFYSSITFNDFAQNTYRVLEKYRPEMPLPIRDWVPKMLDDQFLHRYSQAERMEKVMIHFGKRLPAEIDMPAIWAYFLTNLDVFSASFNVFFPEITESSKHFMDANLNP